MKSTKSRSVFKKLGYLLGLCGMVGLVGAGGEQKDMDSGKTETAVVAGGCFWCMEAVFQRINGVERVVSGYSGGKTENPTYDEVSGGSTGHAEAIEIVFNPAKVSYQDILEVFFHLHDPTTLNSQGADTGTQYRSAIFYNSEIQHQAAEAVKAKVTAAGLWSDPIVTEISPLNKFYPAEDYHQNYYNRNSGKRYCSIVIAPKIQKLLHEFKDRLKPEAAAAANG